MLTHYAPAIWNAMIVTIQLTIISIIFGTLLGIFVGVISSLKSPIRYLARIYIEIFLGLPVLVILVWFYYVLPIFDNRLAFEPFWMAVLAFSLRSVMLSEGLICTVCK